MALIEIQPNWFDAAPPGQQFGKDIWSQVENLASKLRPLCGHESWQPVSEALSEAMGLITDAIAAVLPPEPQTVHVGGEPPSNETPEVPPAEPVPIDEDPSGD